MRHLTRNRYLLPAAVISAVGLAGIAVFSGGAQASDTTTTVPAATTPTTTPVPTTASSAAAAAAAAEGAAAEGAAASSLTSPVAATISPKFPSSPGNTTVFNAGNPRYSSRVFVSGGKVTAYGNRAILYTAPPSSYIPAGEALFAQNCASCHGNEAEGTTAAPNLVGVGPATVDFWVVTGRMPADNTPSIEAPRKPPRLNPTQALKIAAWVNSLDPATPFIPHVNLSTANLSTGASLFALNCAACHTITGGGDALAFGTSAPSLHVATPTEVAEAIRTGPANMPRFTGNLTDAQVRDIVGYVTSTIQHPNNAGGIGLGGLGPVGEGFVGLLFGVGILALICFWIGDRAK
jgi:ubiquinol-cytochrome c reductase cytochrome c subunit